MWTQIKTFFTPPVFADEDSTRQARTLHIILLTLLASLLITVPVEYLYRRLNNPDAGVAWPGPIAIVLLMGLFFLLRRGQVKLVGLSLSLLLFFQVTAVILSEGGAGNAVVSGYLVAILVAGLMSGGWAAMGMALLSSLAIWGVVYLQRTNLFEISPGDGAPVLSYPAIFVVVAIILRLTVDSLNKALNESRRNKEALQETQKEFAKRMTARNHDLQAAVEVSQLLVQTADLQTTLNQVVETIRSYFNLYYVQIYLTDAAGRTLVLHAGSGEVGATLVQRGHRLLVGLGSINGAAAIQKQSIFVKDTSKSNVHQMNPLLPLTRSTIAVPLIANHRVLGTLNIQSDQVDSLNSDILPVFEALAGQLALVIYNNTLIAEAQQATSLMEAQTRQSVVTGWEEVLNAINRQKRIGVAYELTADKPLTEIPSEVGGVAVPVKVMGQPIGAIRLQGEAERDWAREEMEVVQVVADKVARQVENLRLLAQANQYRLEAEAAARRLTHEGWDGYLATADLSPAYMYDLNLVTAWDGKLEGEGKTAVSYPLDIYGEPIGEFVLNGLETADHAKMAVLKAVANKVSSRLETIRLAEQTEKALAQTETLYLGSEQIIRAQNLPEIFLALINNTSLFKLDQASLSLFNRPWTTEKPETITTVATWEKGENQVMATFNTYTLPQFPFNHLFSGHQAVIVTDIATDPRIDNNLRKLLLSQPGLCSLVNLPLITGGLFIGSVLGLSNKPLQLSAEEVKQFTSLTDQASAVIQNLRLYEETQARAEEERLVNEITRKIQETSSIESALQTAIQELGLALQAKYTAAELTPTFGADTANGHNV